MAYIKTQKTCWLRFVSSCLLRKSTCIDTKNHICTSTNQVVLCMRSTGFSAIKMNLFACCILMQIKNWSVCNSSGKHENKRKRKRGQNCISAFLCCWQVVVLCSYGVSFFVIPAALNSLTANSCSDSNIVWYYCRWNEPSHHCPPLDCVTTWSIFDLTVRRFFSPWQSSSFRISFRPYFVTQRNAVVPPPPAPFVRPNFSPGLAA